MKIDLNSPLGMLVCFLAGSGLGMWLVALWSVLA